jgi:hypothetical protein
MGYMLIPRKSPGLPVPYGRLAASVVFSALSTAILEPRVAGRE